MKLQSKSKLIYKILIGILIVALIAIVVLVIILRSKYKAHWGDGKVSEYEKSQIIPATQDIIQGQMSDDRDIYFSEKSEFYEFKGYYKDWNGNPITNVYAMKGAYSWVDENEFNDFEYIFSVSDLNKEFEDYVIVIYFREFSNNKEFKNPNFIRIK